MSPHQIIAVAVRLFAVWLGVYVLFLVVQLLANPGTHNPGLWITLVFFAIFAGIVLALWFFPATISRKLLSSPVTDSVPASSPDLWLTMGCALIGLWLLARTLPALLRDCLVLYTAEPGMEDTSLKAWIYYNLAALVISLWLIFGSRGFRKLFWWAQYAGTKKAL